MKPLETVVDKVRSVLGHDDDGPGAAGPPASGWLAVTVLREDVDLAALPAPLATFGDRIEIRTRTAPRDQGTEVFARLAQRSAGSAGRAARVTGGDPQAELRSALRAAKQLWEVGEVLAVDPAPHGKRDATPAGAALESATERAPRGGVL